MRLFSYLLGSKAKVAGAGIVAVAIFVSIGFFAASTTSALANKFADETDPATILKVIKYYQAIKYCADNGKFKNEVKGDDVGNGVRWWVNSGTQVTIGLATDKWGDKNGLTACNGEDDDNPGWLSEAFEIFGFDPDGGEDTLEKLGYSCGVDGNETKCTKSDINATIVGLVRDSSYLKGYNIDNASSEMYKVATYWGAMKNLVDACNATAGGNSNLYDIKSVQTDGKIKEGKWSIPTSGTVRSGIDPLTSMGSGNTDSCRSTLVAAVNDNASAYANWTARSVCEKNFPQLTSTAQISACAEGWSNSANVIYCKGKSQARACFLGAGSPVNAEGITAGELCVGRFSNDSEAAACINGSLNRGNPNYCNATYPAPDALNTNGTLPADTNKGRRDACAYGAQLAVTGGGTVLSETASPEDEGLTGDDDATTCIIDGIGWMVCPILNAFGGLSDAMYNWIQSVLVVAPLSASSGESASPQYTAWTSMRNIANVLLVIAFLIIIFSQLTSVGVTNYGVKKTLPRLIVVALAINVSFYLMAIAIDLTNIIGTGLYDILHALAPGADATTLNAGAMVTSLLAGTGAVVIAGTSVAIAAASTATAFSLPTLALLAAPVILGVVLALIAAVATLFIRNALLVVLIVISPIAIAAYLLPNTQGLFTKWRKLFMSMLVLFPLAALLFGGAQFAAGVIVNGSDPLSGLAAIFIMAVPLGMLPWLIKTSNSLLGNIGNRLSGLARKAAAPVKKAAGERLEHQRAQTLAGQRNMFGRRQKEGTTNAAQRWNNRRLTRNQETENFKGEAQENWRESALQGGSKAADRAKHALDEQQTHHTRKAANDSSFKLASDKRKNTAGTADYAYNVTSEDNAIKSGAISEQLREAQTQRVVTNQNGVGSADMTGRTAKLRAARNEAQTQAQFDQRVQNSATLTAAEQATRRAQEQSKTIKAEQDQSFEQLKSTDAGLTGLRERQADAQLKTSALTERMASQTQERQMQDPGLLNVRLDAEASKREKAAMEQQVTRQVTEGASAKGGAELVAQAAASAAAQGLTAAQTATVIAERQATADRLQAAQVTNAVATSATTSAGNVQQEEYAQMLVNDAALAQQAGGIDPNGVSRVTAAANSVITDVAIKAINSEKTTMSKVSPKTRTDPSGNTVPGLMDIVASTNGQKASPERKAAAAGIIAKMGGDDDIHILLDYIDTMPETTEAERNEKILVMQQIGTDMGGRKPVSLGAGDVAALNTGTYQGSFDSKVNGRLSGGKLSPEALFTNTSADELQRILAVVSDPARYAPQDKPGEAPGSALARIAELKAGIATFKANPNFKPPSPEIGALIDKLEGKL